MGDSSNIQTGSVCEDNTKAGFSTAGLNDTSSTITDENSKYDESLMTVPKLMIFLLASKVGIEPQKFIMS